MGEGDPPPVLTNKTNNSVAHQSAIAGRGPPHCCTSCFHSISEGSNGNFEHRCSGGGGLRDFPKNNDQYLGPGGNVAAASGNAIVQEAPLTSSRSRCARFSKPQRCASAAARSQFGVWSGSGGS